MEHSEKWPCPECGREFKAAAHLRLHLKSHQVALERKNSAALAAKNQAEKAAIAALMANVSHDDDEKEADRTSGQSTHMTKTDIEDGEEEEAVEEEFDYDLELAKEREARAALARKMWEQSKGLPHKAMLPSASFTAVNDSKKIVTSSSGAGYDLASPKATVTAGGTAKQSSSENMPVASMAIVGTSNDEELDLTTREDIPFNKETNEKNSGDKLAHEDSMGSALVISVPSNVVENKVDDEVATDVDNDHLPNAALVVTTCVREEVSNVNTNGVYGETGKIEERENEVDDGENGLILFSNGSAHDTNGKGSTGSVHGSGKGKRGKGRKGGKTVAGSSKGSLDGTGKGSKGGGKSGKGGTGSSMSSGSSKGGKGFSRPPPPPNKPAHLIPGNSAASISAATDPGRSTSNTAVIANSLAANSADNQAGILRSKTPGSSNEAKLAAKAPSTMTPGTMNSLNAKPSTAQPGNSSQNSPSDAAPLNDASDSRYAAQITSGSSAAVLDTSESSKASAGKGALGNTSLAARRRLRLPPKNPSEIAPLATSGATPEKDEHDNGSRSDKAVLAPKPDNGKTNTNTRSNRSPGNNVFGSVRSKPPPRPPPELTQAMRQAAWEAQFKRKAAAEKASAVQQKKSKAAAARAAEKSTTREAQAAAYKEWLV